MWLSITDSKPSLPCFSLSEALALALLQANKGRESGLFRIKEGKGTLLMQVGKGEIKDAKGCILLDLVDFSEKLELEIGDFAPQTLTLFNAKITKGKGLKMMYLALMHAQKKPFAKGLIKAGRLLYEGNTVLWADKYGLYDCDFKRILAL